MNELFTMLEMKVSSAYREYVKTWKAYPMAVPGHWAIVDSAMNKLEAAEKSLTNIWR